MREQAYDGVVSPELEYVRSFTPVFFELPEQALEQLSRALPMWQMEQLVGESGVMVRLSRRWQLDEFSEPVQPRVINFFDDEAPRLEALRKGNFGEHPEFDEVTIVSGIRDGQGVVVIDQPGFRPLIGTIHLMCAAEDDFSEQF